MRYALLAAMAACVMMCTGVTSAQPMDPVDEETAPDAAEASPGTSPPAPLPEGTSLPQTESTDEAVETPATPQGDVLTLKSGAVLQNVQVIKSTPEYYEVEIREGVDPLRVPRKHVVSVSLDDIDPIKQRRQQALLAKERESDLIAGQKTSPELDAKLNADISNPPLTYDEDLVAVLQDLGQKFSVTIEIAPPVHEIPQPERMWQFESRPGLTLQALLREDLLKAFPQLDVTYQFDKILVATKAAAQPSQDTPPAPPEPELAPAPTEEDE